MSNVSTKNILNLEEAIKYAKERGMTHIVQIYINLNEYGAKETHTEYDPEKVEIVIMPFFQHKKMLENLKNLVF